ncbi:hypothetical protein [uncultured Tateyamaria sp.]|nr:hypothetical protein [uncultured Tateyamaria sp.]
MRIVVLTLVLGTLTACMNPQTQIRPDETTEQFVNRVINSSGGHVGF